MNDWELELSTYEIWLDDQKECSLNSIDSLNNIDISSINKELKNEQN